MVEDDVFEALTDACIAAGEVVMRHGTPEMKEAMRALLFSLAREVARRELERRDDGPAVSDDGES